MQNVIQTMTEVGNSNSDGSLLRRHSVGFEEGREPTGVRRRRTRWCLGNRIQTPTGASFVSTPSGLRKDGNPPEFDGGESGGVWGTGFKRRRVCLAADTVGFEEGRKPTGVRRRRTRWCLEIESNSDGSAWRRTPSGLRKDGNPPVFDAGEPGGVWK